MTEHTDHTEQHRVAEKYLKEMLEADDAANFDLYIKRYESNYLGDFSKDKFDNDIKHMHEQNGMNEGYEFLGNLRNSTVNGLDVFRFVWKGVYEKRDAVIEIAVYKKNDVWHLIKSAVY